ncbi:MULTISPECIES: hypothetical protein [unclassified Ornithinimicrobium]|uniref:hypothetical protein n=1 Tax=unclassified Ornithinimicrobium TaxID=2615080 RepID=UPI003854D1E0
MRTTHLRWGGLLTAGALTLSLTACGGDDEEGDGPTTAAVATDGAEATTEATSEATTDTAADSGPAEDTADAGAGEEVPVDEFMAMLKSPGEEMLSSYTVDMTVNMGAQGLDMSGDVDLSGNEPAIDMDMTMPGMGAITMVVVDDVVFISMPGLTDEGMFMEVPPEQLGDAGATLDEVDITATWDSWDEGAQQILFLGEEDVDGTQMRRYEVTVDAEVALDAAGQTGDDAAAASAAIGDEIVYDVWVDDDDLMRRVTFAMEGATTELLVSNWGQEMDIQAPDADQIQEPGLPTDE